MAYMILMIVQVLQVQVLAANSSSSSACSSLAFLVPLLLTFVQIKFHPGITSSSPFQTHNTTTMVSLASLLAYCLAFEAKQTFPNFPLITSFSQFFMRLSGFLSVVSLLSLVLPHAWYHVPYTIFFLYMFGESFAWIRSMIKHWQVFQVQVLAANSSASTSAYSSLAFIVPLLLTFVQIKFHAGTTSSSPFQTHNTTTMVSLASLLAYCLAFEAKRTFPNFPLITRFSRVFMRLSGLVLVVSLLALVLPDAWYHVPYIIFFLFLITESYAWITSMVYQQVVCRFLCVVLYLSNHHRRVTTRPRLLPLSIADVKHHHG